MVAGVANIGRHSYVAMLRVYYARPTRHKPYLTGYDLELISPSFQVVLTKKKGGDGVLYPYCTVVTKVRSIERPLLPLMFLES
jgi:hypothetical protein